MSEEQLDQSLSSLQLLQLKQRFFEELQPSGEAIPAPGVLLPWLHRELQLPTFGYDDLSDSDTGQDMEDTHGRGAAAISTAAAAPQAAASAAPSAAPPRRTPRQQAGTVSAAFSSVFGLGFSTAPAPAAASLSPATAALQTPGRREGRRCH